MHNFIFKMPSFPIALERTKLVKIWQLAHYTCQVFQFGPHETLCKSSNHAGFRTWNLCYSHIIMHAVLHFHHHKKKCVSFCLCFCSKEDMQLINNTYMEPQVTKN